jgi:GAF domain-containing protein
MNMSFLFILIFFVIVGIVILIFYYRNAIILKKSFEYQVVRDKTGVEDRHVLFNGLLKFRELIRSRDDFSTISRRIIHELVEFLDLVHGSIFIIIESIENGEKHLELIEEVSKREGFRIASNYNVKDGIIGETWRKGEVIIRDKIPENFIETTSGLGPGMIKSFLCIPLKETGEVIGVIELISEVKLDDEKLQFINQVCEMYSSIFGIHKVNEKLIKLLKNSQMQDEELTAQEEELRKNLQEMQRTYIELQTNEIVLSKKMEELQIQQFVEKIMSSSATERIFSQIPLAIQQELIKQIQQELVQHLKK